MNNPLVLKLSQFTRLSEDDERILMDLWSNVLRISAKRDVVRQGTRPGYVRLILEGWAARYEVLPDGARQITAILIPGDFCDLNVSILAQMDDSIVALSPIAAADIPHDALELLARSRPDLSRALWATTLVDEALLRAWIVNRGRRNACQRTAHLICEMHLRLSQVELVEGRCFEMPLTQESLSDVVGVDLHSRCDVDR